MSEKSEKSERSGKWFLTITPVTSGATWSTRATLSNEVVTDNPYLVKAASDILSKSISAATKQNCYSEYGELVEKSFATGLTKAEHCRLEYLAWVIDRFQHAELATKRDLCSPWTKEPP